MEEKSLKVLFVSAEVGPFVSVGGLSQVMYFLPRALKKLDCDVRIFTAKYGHMDTTGPRKKPWDLEMEYEHISVPVNHSFKQNGNDNESLICNIKSFRGSRNNPDVFFLENREYYELRANVFGYKDDHLRFALLSKGCLEWLRKLQKHENGWFPDIIHCNDWHTGYFLNLARTDVRYRDMLENTPIVFTVHNFAYQGNYDFRYLPHDQRDTGEKPLVSLYSPDLIKQNALLRGILYADEINTVSPTHAVEVFTPEYAAGLEDHMQKVKGRLIGILNGIDTDEFNPETDPIIKKNYSQESFIRARRENKVDLQNEFSLAQDPKKPLIAIIGRLSQQKGWDLLLETLPHLLLENPHVQIVVLGAGEDRYRDGLRNLQKMYPEQVGVHLFSNFRLPRKIYAGADMMLMPSVYEPGGIVALEALRYGAVPIVRRTGGLNDIVQDFDPEEKAGNGFSFKGKSSWALYGAIITALTIYRQPDVWNILVKKCMQRNSSWDQAATEYKAWYQKVLEERKRATAEIPHPAYKLQV